MDLTPYIEEFGSQGMKMLRHPLYVRAPWFEDDMVRDHALAVIAQKTKDLENCTDPHRWVFTHERPFRLEALLNCPEPIDTDVLIATWVDCENPYVNHDLWLSLFLEHQEQLEDTLSKLPESFTIYRGGNYLNMSWTLSEDTAKFFASRWNRDTPVHERVVKREDCLAFLIDRDEQEIIIEPRFVT